MVKVVKISFVWFFVLFSSSLYAELIRFNGYELNTETNIVSGNGFEWIQWDVTAGMSIDEAQKDIADGEINGTEYGTGWKVASNVQMASLFNSFTLGGVYYWAPDTERKVKSWEADENFPEQQALSLLALGGDYSNEPEIQFVTLFGNNNSDEPEFIDTFWAAALFGDDLDGDHLFNRSFVFFNPESENNAAAVGLSVISSDIFNIFDSSEFMGVAFVREKVVDVTAPGGVFCFVIGLVALGARRRFLHNCSK